MWAPACMGSVVCGSWAQFLQHMSRGLWNLTPLPGMEPASQKPSPLESWWSEVKWSEVKSPSCVRLFATPWIVAYQAPPSMGFSRQEYWSGLPFPSPWTLFLTKFPNITFWSNTLQVPPWILVHHYLPFTTFHCSSLILLCCYFFWL